MDAMLQQRIQNTWQPLTFFSMKLNPAQQKYSAYDCEQKIREDCTEAKEFRSSEALLSND
jgi:hypothetical protein